MNKFKVGEIVRYTTLSGNILAQHKVIEILKNEYLLYDINRGRYHKTRFSPIDDLFQIDPIYLREQRLKKLLKMGI